MTAARTYEPSSHRARWSAPDGQRAVALESQRGESRSLDEYAGIVDPEVLDELRACAAPLRGLRVLHLTAEPFGGAVRNSLTSLLPLQRDLGIVADWVVLR